MPRSPLAPFVTIASLAAAALLWMPSSAGAQLGIGIAGGPVVPIGDLGEQVDGGFHGGVVLDVALPLLPVGFRGDLFYQRLPGAGSQESYDHFSVTANARLTILPLPLLSGYVTAGAGRVAGRDSGGQYRAGSDGAAVVAVLAGQPHAHPDHEPVPLHPRCREHPRAQPAPLTAAAWLGLMNHTAASPGRARPGWLFGSSGVHSRYGGRNRWSPSIRSVTG